MTALTFPKRSRRPPPRNWGGSMLLLGLRRPLQDFRPVLALTIVCTATAGHKCILVGVRDPRTNKTHQNVTSVPTRRVPDLLANEWKRRLRRGRGELGDSYPGLRNEVCSLLGCKLGLADPLELGEVEFRLGAVGASQGVSVIGERADGSLVTENLTMFNVEVHLEDGGGVVPESTASYNKLVWADVDSFARMVRLRDVAQLNVGLEYAFACAYGLCLQTSLSMLGGPAHAGGPSKMSLFTCPAPSGALQHPSDPITRVSG